MNRKERRIVNVNTKKQAQPAQLQSSASFPAEILARALALHQAGNLGEAEILYKNLHTEYPENAQVASLLGTLQIQRGKVHEAIQLLNKAITLNPNDMDAYNNLGSVLNQLRRYEEALVSYDKAIALNPNVAEIHYNRGNILNNLQRYDEALASFRKVLAIQPNHIDALLNQGVVLGVLQQHREAIASYDKVIALKAGYAGAYYNKGALQLALGEYEEGWKNYEWRWKSGVLLGNPPSVPKPLWLGKESVAGKSILLVCEQGLGDMLQFCRYIPLVEALGAKVTVVAPDVLHSLLLTLPGTFQIFTGNEATPEIDCYCPLMSLPLAFGTTVETIPSKPYLCAQQEYIEKWKPILDERLGLQGLRIGLCWAGGKRPEQAECERVDSRRSVHFRQFRALLEVPNTSFVSLQLGPPKDQLDDIRVVDISSDVKSWSDTAAVISLLDLVITVDTSVCHLAGAMGKKTWMLNRYDTCWRWLLDRDDSPWYPTLTQFRQKTPGDWADVIARIKVALENYTK